MPWPVTILINCITLKQCQAASCPYKLYANALSGFSTAKTGKSGYVWQSLHGKLWLQDFAGILPGVAVLGKALA